MSRRFQRGVLYPLKRNSRFPMPSEPYLIVASFLAVLIPSALLLTFPVFSVTGLSFTDAFFTATSAISVTGLGVVDTGQHFTLSGKFFSCF